MTAQNMGKKILTEAGYDVVAVSNGAAAVKKIAEQKPDIIILDVYMPGYSGLEVCEKVRSSMDTLKTPVLLTVGKMEPYRPEDANRVRADGVIIKPFEASDLIAIVKKLEERVVPKTVPIAEQTVLLERPPEFTSPPAPEEIETHSRPEPAQGIVDVPDHMATAAAFSDLLGMDSSHSLEPLPQPRHAPEPELQVAAPVPEEPAAAPAVPEFSFSAAEWTPAIEPPAPIAEPTTEKVAPPVEEAVKIAPPGYAIEDTQPIPIYDEPESEPLPEPKVAAVPEQHVEREATKVDLHVEPVKPLVAEPVESFHPEPMPAELAAQVFGFGAGASSSEFTAEAADSHRSEPVVSVAESPKIEIEPITPPMQNGLQHGLSGKPAPSTEDDFEARVAAAMSIYDEPVEDKLEPEPVVAYEIEEIKEESLEAEISAAPNPTPFLPEKPFSFEYSPPVAAPAFEPIISEIKAEKAEIEPEHPAVAAKPPVEPESEAKKPPVVLEAHPLETGKISHSTIQKMVEQYAAVRPAPAPVIEPGKPPIAVVHPEPSQPVIEKTSEQHFVAALPVLEPEFTAASNVPEPHPVVHEEVSHAAIEKPAAPAPALEVKPEKPITSEEPHPAVQDEVSPATIEKIAAGIEAELPIAAAASASEIGAQTQIISRVVHRVMERLKPELIEEIARELKNKK